MPELTGDISVMLESGEFAQIFARLIETNSDLATAITAMPVPVTSESGIDDGYDSRVNLWHGGTKIGSVLYTSEVLSTETHEHLTLENSAYDDPARKRLSEILFNQEYRSNM